MKKERRLIEYMSLYKFHTFRTDYFFPDFKKENEFLFGLYHPYNRYPMRLLAVRLYWWLFKHCAAMKRRNLIVNPDGEFPYSKILAFCPKGSVMSFNMGTPGMERKISMLGLEADGRHFFAKYSSLPTAMSLSRNEIKYLSVLKESGLVPRLLDSKEGDDYVFFRTECVEGKNPKEVRMNDAILHLTVRISKHMRTDGELKCALSHGDFTPWNMIITHDGDYKMIDWEMAAERELGYDLFTYITHVGSLLSPDQSLTQLIEQERTYVDSYFSSFGIKDWNLYLKAFAQRRITYEKSKGELESANKYECLL